MGRPIADKKALIMPASDRSKTIRNVHEILPPSNNNEGQGAFRNLFPDDDNEDRMPEASPQFKAF